MDIGTLRHRVTLRNPGPDVPTDGGYTNVYSVVASRVAAEVRPATVRDLERIGGNTVQSSASHLVTIRYRPLVSTKTEVLFHDRTADRRLTVNGVHDMDERHVVLVLSCEEAVD